MRHLIENRCWNLCPLLQGWSKSNCSLVFPLSPSPKLINTLTVYATCALLLISTCRSTLLFSDPLWDTKVKLFVHLWTPLGSTGDPPVTLLLLFFKTTNALCSSLKCFVFVGFLQKQYFVAAQSPQLLLAGKQLQDKANEKAASRWTAKDCSPLLGILISPSLRCWDWLWISEQASSVLSHSDQSLISL